MRLVDRSGFEPRALAGATAVTAALLLAIIAGSRGLRDFDPALTHYAIASVIAAFAISYRYAVWLSRPPTRRYLSRSLELYRAGGPARSTVHLGGFAATTFGGQTFIARRGLLRWVMHLCLSWGTMLAFAVTFPLVFGWLHFEPRPDDADVYRMMAFGLAVQEFPVDSLVGFAIFNALNLSGVLVLTGVSLSLYRRLHEGSDLALQQFGTDVMPLLLLFAVAATGLLLTVSARALDGAGYGFLGLTHAATVISLLLYLPFGKLFHIVQRPMQLGVALYKRAGAAEAADCARCGAAFAPAMQVADLKRVLGELGIDGRAGPLHFQDICPPCRRRVVALSQGRLLGR